MKTGNGKMLESLYQDLIGILRVTEEEPGCMRIAPAQGNN